MRSFFARFSILVVVLLGFTMLNGCITINLGGATPDSGQTLEPAPTTPPPAAVQTPRQVLNEERLLNADYLSPLFQVPITLVGGVFSGVVDGSELKVTLQPGIQYGDLNDDGVEDAAFILAESTGGSGVFYSLVVVFSEAGRFVQAPGMMIDDRPVIESLTIENGVVKLQALVHSFNDTMVNPSTRIRAEYSLLDGKLVQTRLSSAFSGSEEHVITIDSPRDGDTISGSVRLIGSMPIGPFENTLLLRITDLSGGELLHEGFMVQTEDLGAPATFDNTVLIPGIAPGTRILLTLSELSMADGSPIALDSVLLVVGE